MRLAMAISPSRVSSSTVPISRMYMRTGSVVRPPSVSSAVSAAAASSAATVSSSVRVGRGVGEQQRFGIRRNFMHLDAHAVDHADDVFDLFRIDDVVGQVIVDLGVGQVALLQALADQQLDFVLLRRAICWPWSLPKRGIKGTAYYTGAAEILGQLVDSQRL